ncbi:MAG TPA: hypothetical protein VF271_01405 [Rhodanobacteraceae bacterium]
MPTEHRYETITDWQHLDPAVGATIRAFWLREQANVAGAEATRRLAEVVAHIVDENGNLAAVATAGVKVLPRLGQPLYYYRCFVGQAWRSSKLVRPLLRRSQDVLQHYARANGYPCIGVLLELENKGFSKALRWARWPRLDFSFIGISPRGLELRVWYFRGAVLKTPAEMARLQPQSVRTRPALTRAAARQR